MSSVAVSSKEHAERLPAYQPPRDSWEGYRRVKGLLEGQSVGGVYVDADFLPSIQPGGYYIPQDWPGGDQRKVTPARHAFWKEYYRGVMQNVRLTVWLLNEARSRRDLGAISAQSRRNLGAISARDGGHLGGPRICPAPPPPFSP